MSINRWCLVKGLLDFAFSPEFDINNYFYVSSTIKGDEVSVKWPSNGEHIAVSRKHLRHDALELKPPSLLAFKPW